MARHVLGLDVDLEVVLHADGQHLLPRLEARQVGVETVLAAGIEDERLAALASRASSAVASRSSSGVGDQVLRCRSLIR